MNINLLNMHDIPANATIISVFYGDKKQGKWNFSAVQLRHCFNAKGIGSVLGQEATTLQALWP